MEQVETKVDVLADPQQVEAARKVLFAEFAALVPEDCRNFGPNMHGRVLEAMAGDDAAAKDAVAAYLLVRDAATVESMQALRTDIIRAALARVGGGK